MCATRKKGAEKPSEQNTRTRVSKKAKWEAEAAKKPGADIAPVLTAVQEWQKGVAERAAARKLQRAKKATGGAAKARKSIELMREICRRIGLGEALQDVCDDADMPERCAVFNWINEDEQFKKMYQDALVLRGEAHADRITELAQEAMLAPPELTNAYRLAVDSYKWTAARLIPRKYGDRVTVAGDSDNPLQVQHLPASEELLAKIKGSKK